MSFGDIMRDPYAVLGVKRDADAAEIKSAWRAIAKKIHPDQNRSDPNAAKLFAEAGEAYEVLRDPKRRSRYDMLSRSGKQEATIQQQREAAREAEAKRKAAEENARKVMEELAKAQAEKARKDAQNAANAQKIHEQNKAGAKAQAEAKPQQAQSQNQSQGQSQAQPQSQSQAKPQADTQAKAAEAGAAQEPAAGETPEAMINRIFGAQPQYNINGEPIGTTADPSGPPVNGTAADPGFSGQGRAEPHSSGGQGGGSYGQQPLYANASAAYESTGEAKSGSPSGSAQQTRTSPMNPIEAVAHFLRRLTGGAKDMEKAPDQLAEAKVTIADLLSENWITVQTADGRELRFRLEAGMSDGEQVRLKGQGFKVPGMLRGDAVITLKVEPTAQFSVRGHDIVTTVAVPLENAVLGCKTVIDGPTGPVELEVPAWSGSDQAIRVAGLGLFDGKGGRGDLVAEVRLMLWEKPDAKVTDLMRAMREGLYL